MPSRHEIDAPQRRAHVWVWGEPNARSALAAIHELVADTAFESDFSVLVDARELDDGDAPLHQVEQVAGELTSLHEQFRGKIAVITQIGAHYDLLRLMSAFAGTFGVRVQPFIESKSAETWLDEDG